MTASSERGSWPSTAFDFLFEKPRDGAPRGLTLDASFDASAYLADPAHERVREDAATFELIARELAEPGARVIVHCTMDSNEPRSLDPRELATFAGGAASFLRALVEGGTPPPALSIHVAMEPRNGDDIFPLEVTIATSSAEHHTELKAAPRDFEAFANAFEAAYADADSYLKVLSEETEHGISPALWAMRLRRRGAPEGAGVAFAIDGPARYYAPAALANVPLSRSDVPIPRYDPVTGVDWDNPDYKSFASVDMDMWALATLTAIDRVLETVDDDAHRESLNKLSTIRGELATCIAATVSPILPSMVVPRGSPQLENAIKIMRQQIFLKARRAYDIAAICQFEATVRSKYEDDPAKAVYAPRFTGTLRSSARCEFSPVRAVLAPGKAFVSSALTLAQDEAQSRLPLDLRFDIEGVQYTGARAALTFLIPFDAAIGAVDIPIALRELPAVAMPLSQEAAASETAPADIDAAERWTYALLFAANLDSQDAIEIAVSFNNTEGESSRTSVPATRNREGLDLFDHLARIVSALPAMLQNAKPDVGEFVRLVEPLPAAWAAWRPPVRQSQTAQMLSLRERQQDGFLVLTRTLVPGAALLPEPSIQVISGTTTYSAQPAPAPNEFYYADETGKRLTYEDGRNLTARRIAFAGFDVASLQNASAAFHLTRNEGCSREFVYSSMSSFSASVMPQIVSGKRLDVSLLSSPGQQTLATHLQRVIGTLYKGATDVETRTIRFDAAYVQRISADMDGLPLPIFAGKGMILNREGALEFANESAAVLSRWFDQTRPPEGYFRFALTLFPTLSEKELPLLELRALELERTNITDLP